MRTLSATAICLALVSCGDGGSSGGTVGTTPAVPTPSPPPPSPPPPAPPVNLLPPLASQTFDASIAQVRLDQLNTAPLTNSNINAVLGASGSVRLAYNATNDGYTLSNVTGALDFSYAFTSADRLGDDGTIKEFRQIASPRTSILDVFDPGTANRVLALTYVSYANLLLVDRGATSSTAQFRTVAYGIKTATLPTTGTVTYTAVVDGIVVPVRGTYRPFALATATITVDFAARTVRGTIHLIGNDDPSGLRGGTNVNFGDYSLSGSINATTGIYSLNVTTPGLQFGSATGNFFGPNAAEIGMSIAVNDTTANNPVIALSLVGKAN